MQLRVEQRNLESRIKLRLQRIYGDTQLSDDLLACVERHAKRYKAKPYVSWSEQDVILITYGDSLQDPGHSPLQTMHRFLRKYLRQVISAVHVLPFFPFSSDDGFSIIDYRQVNYKIGSLEQMIELGKEFDLMVDLVLNHASRQSLWFIDFINNRGRYKDFFIEMDPDEDVSAVVRPRTSPLIVDVYTRKGLKHVWATFSDDQIDLNFANPKVLLEMIDILLDYIQHGARYVRLDAVAFMWKRLGTSCIHLEETHEVVKLMRDIMSYLDPNLILITETNVPHKENVSYFGEGDEAHMVYNFALPPLILHGLNRGNASYLTRWAKQLQPLHPDTSYLNFVASHDGIGVRSVEQIIPKHEIKDLIDSVHRYGGFVSMKSNSDGSKSPYELNISLFEMLQGTRSGPDLYQVPRFLCSQIIMLAIKGIPAVYLHSLTATQNDQNLVEQTGRTRSINRHSWDVSELEGLLADPNSPQAQVFSAMCDIIRLRREQPAFHPEAPMRVLVLSDTLFAFIRISLDKSQQLLCINNVSPHSQRIPCMEKLPQPFVGRSRDLIANRVIDFNQLEIKPYQCLWIEAGL